MKTNARQALPPKEESDPKDVTKGPLPTVNILHTSNQSAKSICFLPFSRRQNVISNLLSFQFL